ncbi:CRISPR-associated HD domain protein [Acidianus hospitalis W1]|uniref:CRISPR-associated HD domain protein n=1 Tax=Acidianus hospitalis (strain W1) TaxID=933801 RepID=F4B6S6_ACIHW|nr:CRISPR-associated HD domain protein [Acidianus hospitalis W1]
MVYLSKPCAFIKQTLFDHSMGSYAVLSKFINYTYYAVISRRLKSVGIQLKPEEVKRLIEISVKLHDIGKAAEYYQNQFDENCLSNKKEPSFIFHEIGSSLFFYYSNYTNDNKVKRLLALAALNHLNAIRGLADFKPNQLPKGAKEEMLKIEKYGKVLLSKLGFNFEVRDYTTDDYIKMMNDFINRPKDEDLKLYKLHNLFLAPIIIGDNLDSHYARSISERRRFIKLLEVELNEDSII